MFSRTCFILALLGSQISALNVDTRPSCPCENEDSIDARVVGGRDAGRGHFPYASALIDKRGDYDLMLRYKFPFCGATLITDRHLITAAHCVRSRKAREFVAEVNFYDLNKEGELHSIKSITRYPYYEKKTFHDDAAIIELDKPVTFYAGLKTAILPDPYLDLTPGTIVSVYGWGRLEYDGYGPEVLQTVDMPVIANEMCQEKFQHTIDSNMMCAGGQEGKDACIGDSGSGLVVRLNNEYVLYGVVSFGRKCALAHVPGVYTRIPHFVDWIVENTKTSGCRPCVYDIKNID